MSFSPSAPPAKRTRVFVVDDHPLVREGLVSMINREPQLEVCGEAEGCEAALALIADRVPDLVITDLSLRDGSGLNLIKELRARHASLQILVVSMHEEPYYAERAFRAGARGYLTKRESTTQLAEAIRRVLKGAMYASNDLLEKLAERLAHPAAGEDQRPVDRLSDRELQVFQLFGQGLETKQVARDLHVSIKTVEANRFLWSNSMRILSTIFLFIR
jgi:DNA-binding NarL/FixJ family response regulator